MVDCTRFVKRVYEIRCRKECTPAAIELSFCSMSERYSSKRFT